MILNPSLNLADGDPPAPPRLANIRYYWVAAGVQGSVLSAGVTQPVADLPVYRLNIVPPPDAEEVYVYDVTDPGNWNVGGYAIAFIRDNIANAIAGGGTGALTVTINVTDGADPLENATVRLTEGANSRTARTDASGNAVFALDPATYSMAITKDGYQFAPTPIEVDETHTEFGAEMDQIVVAGSTEPDYSIGVLTTRDEFGRIEPNVTITFRLLSATGVDSYKTKPVHVTSNGAGLLAKAFPIGAQYEGQRATGPRVKFTVPDDEDPFPIPQLLGQP